MTREILRVPDTRRPEITVTKCDLDNLECLLSIHATHWSWRSVEYLVRELMRATIVDEGRRSLAWLARDGAAHGADAEKIVVGGHSAGGHIAAMLYTTDWTAHGIARDPIAGGVSISGVHDLAPMVQFSFNLDFKLDLEEAARLSPVHLPSLSRAPLVIAAGADETSEFLRQARILWAAWPANRPQGAHGPMLIRSRNHFDVVADLADARSELSRANSSESEAVRAKPPGTKE